MKAPAPGIHRDVPEDEYHRWDAFNVSLAKVIREQTPAHARRYQQHPPESSAAMEFGTAVHCAILEPEKFGEKVILGLRHDRRSAANKAAWELFEKEHAGKIILKADQLDHCSAMAAAVEDHPLAMSLLTAPGIKEASMVWQDAPARTGDEELGMLCKARIDILCRWRNFNCIVDVKTIAGYTAPTPVSPRGTGGASKRRLEQQMASFSYDMQAGFYLRGAKILAPEERRFLFIFVEKTPPYGVHVVEPNITMLGEGEDKCRLAMRTWARCEKSGSYPCYGNEITSIDIPKYAQMTEEELEELAA